MIYLDNNATTKVDEKVLESMMPYFTEEYANPSSIYDFSKKSSRAIKEARGVIKDFINANDEKEIIFTSCGSESANTAIKGVLNYNKAKKHIVTTKVEHPCVLNVYKSLEKQGYKVDYLSVNSNGDLDLEELDSVINPETALVSIMWANNETGVINPIKKVSEIIKSKNPDTKLFVDAVQVAGKIPMDVQEMGIDLLGISGHKFHAPKGVGALYLSNKVKIDPIIFGGNQERGKRGGTSNTAGIVGFAKASEIAHRDMKTNNHKVRALSEYFVTKLAERVENANFNANTRQKLPHIISVSFVGVDGESLLTKLDINGLAVSTGSACSTNSLTVSHVMTAIGLNNEDARGTIRFSLGKNNSYEELDKAINIIARSVEELRAYSSTYGMKTRKRKGDSK